MDTFDKLCTKIQESNEDALITLVEQKWNIRPTIAALLDMWYILDNYEMTSAWEYPYLPGKKDGMVLFRLNKTLQKIHESLRN
jgi:hypothetical protein